MCVVQECLALQAVALVLAGHAVALVLSAAVDATAAATVSAVQVRAGHSVEFRREYTGASFIRWHPPATERAHILLLDNTTVQRRRLDGKGEAFHVRRS